MSHLLGRAKGPGPTPQSFLLVSPDPDQELKVGEFITYQAQVEGELRDILARVIERRPLRLYPDSFSADPTVDPRRVGMLVGYGGRASELFEITADVIGYYDLRIKDFINPRIPPRVGTPIALASDEHLSQVLSRVPKGEIGAATMGSLLSRLKDRVPIAIDVNAVASKHLAIIASTGAGKSYTASVLIEEMLKPNNRAAILIIDPHGEYDTMQQLPNAPELQADGYRPEARIHKPGEVKLRVGGLEQGDLNYLLPEISERMAHVLEQAYRLAQKTSYRRCGHGDRWTVEELKDAVKRIGGIGEEYEGSDDTFEGTARAVLWRIDRTLKTGGARSIFDDAEQTALDESEAHEGLFRPGRCTVMRLDQVDGREQQVIVAALLRRIFYARVRTNAGNAQPGDDFYLPYPVFVLIEEAHNFAPAGTTIVTTNILKKILAEGRKFGVGVGLISQRPGKLDPDVLSQCNTQFLLRIVNPVDQDRVAGSVESVGRDLLRELPSLTKGQAIISGAAVNTPVLCRIRQRHTEHGAEDIKAADEWTAYFGVTQSNRRKRDSAPMQIRRSGSRRRRSD